VAKWPRFLLAVNGDQGSPTGRITALHFVGIHETVLELDAGVWPPSVCPRFERLEGFVRISRRRFPVLGYHTWAGNWCWDAISVTPVVGAELLNYLKGLGWHCEGGHVCLGDIWRGIAAGGRFRPSDLAAACMTEAELEERKRARSIRR